MSFSGGVYTLPGPALVTGDTVSATENNQFRNDVAGAFNLTFLRNGTSTATANLPMGGYKLTGLGAPSTNGDSLAYGAAAVVTTLTSTSLTATRVPYAGTGGLLQDASTFTFDGATLTAGGFSTSGNISAATATVSGNITVSGGTANGVAYLNGSKVLTTGSALTFDGTNFATTGTASATKLIPTGGTATGNGMYLPAANTLAWSNNGSETMRLDSSGNLGLGVTPSAWSGLKGLQNGRASLAGQSSEGAWLTNNAFYNGTNWVYMTSSQATMYQQLSGVQSWHTAPSGTAGNAISFTQAMTLDASGNLGIGTSSPATYGRFVSKQSADTGVSSNGIAVQASTTDTQLGIGYHSSSDTLRLTSTYASTGAYKPLSFWTSDTERMRIDSSGNVGIGTSSPQGKFQIGSLTSGTAEATYKGDAIIQGGPNALEATGGLEYKTSTSGSGYGWKIAALNTTNDPLVFGNRANSATWTERMRIDSGGTIVVKATSSNYNITTNGTSRYIIHDKASSDGAGFTYQIFQSVGSSVGSISFNGSGVSYNTSSDYRLKENIQPMQNALAVVQQLNPVTYTWKADGSEGQGFIAHELQAVVPDCVTGEKDAVRIVDVLDDEGRKIGTKEEPVYQGIDTSFLVATLTKAIQELKAELDATKAEVAELKGA